MRAEIIAANSDMKHKFQAEMEVIRDLMFDFVLYFVNL